MEEPAATSGPKAGERGEPSTSTDRGEEPTIVERLRAAPITFLFAAINVAVFVWAESGARSTRDPGTLVQFGALEAVHVWAGEYWRLATSMFLHIGWMHIAWNTYASIGWCTLVERALGHKRFLFLYLVSGIGAACVSVAATMIFGHRISAGASGAMFGIVGATLALRRRQLPSFSAFFRDPPTRSTLVTIAIWTAIGLTALQMDNSAHFGGLVTGFAMTWVLTTRTVERARTEWLVFGAVFAALLVIAVRPWWVPRGKDSNWLIAMSDAYFQGETTDGGSVRRWPHDELRGTKLLTKACSRGVAPACGALADHIDRTGAPDASSRSEPLRRRMCELDPPSCMQLH